MQRTVVPLLSIIIADWAFLSLALSVQLQCGKSRPKGYPYKSLTMSRPGMYAATAPPPPAATAITVAATMLPAAAGAISSGNSQDSDKGLYT